MLVSHPRIILAMRVGGHYHYSIMLLKQEMIEPIVIEPIIKKSCPIGVPLVLAIICSYRDLCNHRYFTCVEYL